MLICDNDNVAPYGEHLGIAGKCRYMAPEVVMGKKRDIHSDRFSLSVILYLLLFLNHPLEGKSTLCPCLTEELERKFYGFNPVFVWDNENDKNRPVRGVHVNEIRFWPVYPSFVHNVFLQAFHHASSVGDDMEHRVQEKKWQETFVALRGVTIMCSCHSETFVKLKQPNQICMNCGKALPTYPILHIKKYQVVLAPGQRIYACHTTLDSEDCETISGEVVTSLSNAAVLGLKNNSNSVWKVTLLNGVDKSYEPGKVMKLGKGMYTDFKNGHIATIL